MAFPFPLFDIAAVYVACVYFLLVPFTINLFFVVVASPYVYPNFVRKVVEKKSSMQSTATFQTLNNVKWNSIKVLVGHRPFSLNWLKIIAKCHNNLDGIKIWPFVKISQIMCALAINISQTNITIHGLSIFCIAQK